MPEMQTINYGQQAPLTNWKKEPSVQDLKRDLEAAKGSHDLQVGKIQRWSDLLRVSGQYKPAKRKGRSQVQPKLIRRQAEWRYSALTEPFMSSDKIFSVSPVTFEDGPAAKQNQTLLNWQFRTKVSRLKFIDDYVRSTVDDGTSIVRVGWQRLTTPITEEVPVYEYARISDEQELALFQQALQAKAENPREFDEKSPPELKAAVDYFEENQIATTATQVKTEQVETEKVVVNRPTLQVMDPRNVFIDPSCEGEIDKAMFVVVSFETSKAELAKEPKRYKNLDKINWEGNTPLSQPDHATSIPDDFQFPDRLRKRVVAYEYWGFYDVNGTDELVPFVCTWIGDTMIRMELNPFPDQKLPFVVVPYMPVKRELYGEPDAELLEDNQKILGAVTRGMIDLLGRSANGQRGFAKGMLDPLNRRRFESGNDYEFNPNFQPTTSYVEHKYPEIPRSALEMIGLQNQEAEALTGVKSFSGGISGEAYGDVAAGIKGVIDAAAKREMAILRRLAKGMVDIGKKIIAMNGEFLSEKEVIRVTNEDFVEIFRDELPGDFDLEVDISTSEIENLKAQDLAFLLQTLGPDMPGEFKQMIIAEIAELKKMPDMAMKIRRFQPTPDPYQEKLKELAVLKAQKEIEEIDSKIALNQAKAQEALAQKDMKNLDFVEQESGTKHARDMEKIQSQAESNQDLAVTKSLLTPSKEGETRPDVETAVGFNALSRGIGDKALGSTALTPVGIPANPGFPPA